MLKALVVDDEEVVQDVIGKLLNKEGVTHIPAYSILDAKDLVNNEDFDLVLLDLRLPDGDGLDFLPELKEALPNTPIIVLTAYGTVESAVKAIKEGAFDFIEKPFSNKSFLDRVKKALKLRKILKENIELKAQLESIKGFGKIIGKNHRMLEIYEVIKKVASTNAIVLIEGESGVGKEVVAEEIHERSKRKHGPFIVFHCGNIPSDLVESHLFGHKKGAFTGATEDKKGFIEEAHGGTLLLDDITILPLPTQAKLLRFLETREFIRLGDTKPRKANVRILVATNEPVESAVYEGRFREDLFYRINVIKIKIPPLRKRKEDIPLFIFHFLEMFSKEYGKPIKGIKESAMEKLLSYKWPGNVRELKNAIESAVVLAKGEWIGLDDLPESIRKGGEGNLDLVLGGRSYKEILEDFERMIIKKALAEAGGVQKKAAEILKINPSTLNMAMKRLGIK